MLRDVHLQEYMQSMATAHSAGPSASIVCSFISNAKLLLTTLNSSSFGTDSKSLTQLALDSLSSLRST